MTKIKKVKRHVTFDTPMEWRLRRDPSRVTATTDWSKMYAEYERLTGEKCPEQRKTAWRRMGKLMALQDLEIIAKSLGHESGFAWSVSDVGLKVPNQKTLTEVR